MKLDVDEKGNVVLQEVFNGITLKTEDKETIHICMRDSGFEFSYNGHRYEAKGGELKKMGKDVDRNRGDVFCMVVGCPHSRKPKKSRQGHWVTCAECNKEI